MKHFFKKYKYLLTVFAGITFCVSCASIGTPSGGAFDFDPPKLVKSTPTQNQLHVKDGKVELLFDENVIVQEPTEKVIVTPPQRKVPQINSVNRKVQVILRDTLIPNTTYTVDFTDAIVDNNEDNPFENFAISFSTGDHIDSLAISGTVLTANNLEPVKGIYVGLHKNLSDTAFTHNEFLRISRTNERGKFTIRGVAPGKYKIYALDDVNREYKYNNPSAAIAFMDSIIVPTTMPDVRTDTIYTDKKDKDGKFIIDTIKTVDFTRYLPDNIVLRSFVSGFQRKYLQKYERTPNQAILYFGAPTPMPHMEPMNFPKNTDWYVLERTAQNDTLTFWIKDKNILAMDTLAMHIDYLETDTLNKDILVTDTLLFFQRGMRAKPKKQEKKKEEKDGKTLNVIDLDKEKEDTENRTYLDILNNIGSNWERRNLISLTFSEPIEGLLDGKIKLQQRIDSTLHDLPFEIRTDSLNPRTFILSYNKWQYGGEYQLMIDSASVYSIYGLWNKKLDKVFKVKKEEEYSKFGFIISGIGDAPAYVELLDKSDNPVRKSQVVKNVALFNDLIPGSYYARIILDRNGNGKWDTGDYYTKTEPEIVSYFNKPIEMTMANFQAQENWHVDTLNLVNQKPLEITKNKPKEKATRQKQLEEEERKKNKNNQQNNNNNSTGNQQNMNLPQGMTAM